MPSTRTGGAVIPADQLRFSTADDGVATVTAVGPHLGAHIVRLDVVRIPAGGTWTPAETAQEENIAVIFSGEGTARSGAEHAQVTRADAVFAPTMDLLSLTASGPGLTAYVWRTTLRPGRTPGARQRRFNRLWNEETQLLGFTGTGKAKAQGAPPP